MASPAPSTWNPNALRAYASQGSIRPHSFHARLDTPNLGSASVMSAEGVSQDREGRRERRIPLNSTVHHDGSDSSKSAYSSVYSSAGTNLYVRAHHASPPPSSITPIYEETYLDAKRNAKLQGYFDSYPERGVSRMKDKGTERAGDIFGEWEIEAARNRSLEKAAMVSTTNNLRKRIGDNISGSGDKEDSYEMTSCHTSLRKSTSVDAYPRMSSSIAAPGVSRKGKDRDLYAKEADEEEQISFPAIRSSRSTISSSAYSHFKSSSGSSAHTLAPAKVPNHPYGSFRDDFPTSTMPSQRYSYSTHSSSQTQGDTPSPPETPIDSGSRLSLEVLVAAPINGVEAMDALVEGMGISDEDDLFRRLQFLGGAVGKSSRHNGLYPLYVPPLPTPPPGVVLGRGSGTRRELEHVGSEIECEDSEVYDRPNEPGETLTFAKKRLDNKRSLSSIDTKHDVRPATAPTSLTEAYQPPPSIDEIIRKYTQTDNQQLFRKYKTNTRVPTISEIVSKHSQALERTSTSTHSAPRYSSVSEPEPEPLSSSEAADLVTRSSIDSVAAEIQQQFRTQNVLNAGGSASNAANTHAISSGRSTPESHRRFSYYSFRTASSAPSNCGQSGTASVSQVGAVLSSTISSYNPDIGLFLLQQGSGQRKQNTQKDTQNDAIATYLQSPRITTLLKLTRRPHASPDRPLIVSLSDLGSQSGHPLVVFLGLGCVRYVMGLYDEMAECLGLRLIAIDRWGLGRTEVPQASAARGVPEWSTVVEEVLDRLNIQQCSVMAHSAGAPYALSFASKNSDRIVGDVCLLAPWVGGGAGGGYRWLKYVPNGILKTAQAAEWKIQAWMIGKPPKITYEGIGYDIKAPVSSTMYNSDPHEPYHLTSESSEDEQERSEVPGFPVSLENSNANPPSYPYSIGHPAPPRSSNSSGKSFSDYDDLEDFNGRFESRTTLELQRRRSTTSADGSSRPQESARNAKKKSSKGFLRIWKGLPSSNIANAPPVPPIDTAIRSPQSPPSSHTQSQSQAPVQFQNQQPQGKSQGRILKPLRSFSSLKTKPQPTHKSRSKSTDKIPELPQKYIGPSINLGLDKIIPNPPLSPLLIHHDLDKKITFPRESTSPQDQADSLSPITGLSVQGYGKRRSMSFSATTASYSVLSRPVSLMSRDSSQSAAPHTTSTTDTHTQTSSSTTGSNGLKSRKSGDSFQVALGNALIAASHAESARGTHPDLLQILNHEQRPWGFSYARYPHRVRVWYGDRDERIASHAVRWMESTMGQDRCRVTVVKGADHGLMYKTDVVISVFEHVLGAWQDANTDYKSMSSFSFERDTFKYR